jgi:hypothetical protein
LAAQPTRTARGDEAKSRHLEAEYVVALRQDNDVADRVSTVDDVNDYRGRVAAVLALEQLRTGRTGHYGFADGATAALPPAGP